MVYHLVFIHQILQEVKSFKSYQSRYSFHKYARLISPMAPFGGLKDSARGKKHIESIKEYTRIKTTWYNSSEKPMSDPFTMG